MLKCPKILFSDWFIYVSKEKLNQYRYFLIFSIRSLWEEIWRQKIFLYISETQKIFNHFLLKLKQHPQNYFSYHSGTWTLNTINLSIQKSTPILQRHDNTTKTSPTSNRAKYYRCIHYPLQTAKKSILRLQPTLKLSQKPRQRDRTPPHGSLDERLAWRMRAWKSSAKGSKSPRDRLWAPVKMGHWAPLAMECYIMEVESEGMLFLDGNVGRLKGARFGSGFSWGCGLFGGLELNFDVWMLYSTV